MLGKNLLASVFTQIPVFIFGIVGGMFSTRILGEESKGLFSLFQANSQLFVLVFSLGIQTGIVYFIASKKISEDKVAGITFYIFSVSSGLLFLFLIATYFLDITDFFLPEKYNSLVYLFILFSLYLFLFLNSILSSFFQAHSQFKIINKISIINGLCNAVLFAFLYLFIETSDFSITQKFNCVLLTTLLLTLLNTVFWLFHFVRKFNISPDFNFKPELKTFILYNILIYSGMFINFFNYRLDIWIVNHYLSEKELSYYSLAANINQIILYASVAIGSVMLPNLSSKNEEDRIATFIKISRASFVFFFTLTTIAFLTSSIIIPFMYGEVFENSVLPLQILLPGILFSSITQLFSILLVSINKNIFNIIACSIGLVFTVILDFILIPNYGIKGASIATSISYFSIFLFTYIFILNISSPKTFNFFIPNKVDLLFLRKNFLKKSI